MAFSDGGYIPAEAIAEIDITMATERWVVPVVGQALLEKVAEGEYAELKSDYIAPAVAFYTRYLAQPAREELRRSLKARAQTALKRLSEYLDANTQLFAEYNPAKNILKRCSFDGGFVQVR